MSKNPFANRDIISTRDFTKEEIEFLIEVASGMEDFIKKGSTVLRNKILASIFLEPSTRTRLSFDAAMKMLGGNVIGFSDWEKSSLKKGETLSDTLRVIENYSNVIVIRSKYEGAAKYATEIVDIPVINAGSGAQEHPTQAFLDLMCIIKEKGKIDGLSIGLCGDLQYGRTIHSLIPIISNYDINLKLISPPTLKLRKQDIEILEKNNVTFEELEPLDDVINQLDVLYMTRIQRERFPSEEDFLKVREYYVLNNKFLENAKRDVLIMHPLPRINEIDESVDSLPQAVYFKQPRYGLYIRMALLGLILDVF
ncbi:MAG: aspartate carbamoyltransferase [Promethearchaeota archaeon]